MTGPHVYERNASRPDGVAHKVDAADGTEIEPPAMTALRGAAATRETIVVAVRGTKHHPVGDVVRVRWHHRITGVSAVPGHCQPVITDLSKYDSYSNNIMSII